MVNCPRCGNEVFTPVKWWFLGPRRKEGQHLRISLYECPRCWVKFRVIEKTGRG